MTETKKSYDLEERTEKFARNVASLVLMLPKDIPHTEMGRQLIRSAGSVGANYIEANESLSRKDFVMRAKICRKEAKESAYWLRLLPSQPMDAPLLAGEAIELVKIFNAIVEKSK